MVLNWRFLTGAAGATRRHSAGIRIAGVVMLAAVLALVGVNRAQAAPVVITCGINETGCQGSAFFDVALGTQSYTWQFWQFTGQQSRMVYSFTLTGSPGPSYSFFVDVIDHPATNDQLVNKPSGLNCVTSIVGNCLVFTAQATTMVGTDGSQFKTPIDPDWLDGYQAAILWIQSGEVPPPDTITLLKHDNGVYTDFSGAVSLTDIRYSPYLAPPDPGIGGKGDTFSTFGVFEGSVAPARLVDTKDELLYGTPVPEPAGMILLATGLAGLAFRARRRRQ